MLFNSLEFAIFLPIVFALYWLLKEHLRLQNWLLLVVSYIFYGWWDWRFLSLIAFSSVVDYFVGLQLSRTEQESKRKLLLIISLVVNLGFLGFFKYYNFFLESFVDAFTFLGQSLEVRALNIVLPVGISFYTFQTLSYSIDVYKGKLEPAKDPVAFFAYVSFFPQLVAGPIERATNLLPQFYNPRHFDYAKAVDGCRQMLWGFFKKIVIADNCASFVNQIFGNHTEYPGSVLLLGAFFFAFQIYCDFSGYSDIAIGTARLFGIDLMRNFAFPYFSRDIAEFWRRWHISLSTWFRDYLYIPLGGSKGGTWMKVRNTMVIFVVSGFWHGANWTFIIWGFINALYFLPLLLAKQNRKNLDNIATYRLFPSLKETLQIAFTFFITLIAWVFFRANDLSHAMSYLAGMFSSTLLASPLGSDLHSINAFKTILLIFFLVVVEWLQRDKQHALDLQHQPVILKWSAYYGVILLIVFFGEFNVNEFIYFQF